MIDDMYQKFHNMNNLLNYILLELLKISKFLSLFKKSIKYKSNFMIFKFIHIDFIKSINLSGKFSVK
jgi:hypothetical protein